MRIHMASDGVSVTGAQDLPSFAGFEVLGMLGRGSSGIVLLARRPDGGLVAVKRLIGDWHDDAQRARFRREARIITGLDHPHIVRSEGFFEDDGEAFLVMEHIAGPSLEKFLQEAPLSTANALAVLSSLAGALAYAHDRGVLHRDITPTNVLFNESGQPKLGDFGVAKILGPDFATSLVSLHTHTGALLGTPAYMSPEAAEGVAEFTARADVYSLGVLAYRLLVGRLPFPFDGNVLSTLEAHITHPVPRPAELGVNLPPALEAAMLRALAKDPTARHSDAAGFWAEIAAAADEAWPHWRDRVDLESAVDLVRSRPKVRGVGPPPGQGDVTAPIAPGRSAKNGPVPRLSNKRIEPSVFKPRKRHRWPGLVISAVLGAVVAIGVFFLAGFLASPSPLVVGPVAISASRIGEARTGCPETLLLTGHIVTNGQPGRVSYAWALPEKRPGAPHKIMVRSGEDALIETASVMVTPTGPASARAILRVLGPTPSSSASVPLALRCP